MCMLSWKCIKASMVDTFLQQPPNMLFTLRTISLSVLAVLVSQVAALPADSLVVHCELVSFYGSFCVWLKDWQRWGCEWGRHGKYCWHSLLAATLNCYYIFYSSHHVRNHKKFTLCTMSDALSLQAQPDIDAVDLLNLMLEREYKWLVSEW